MVKVKEHPVRTTAPARLPVIGHQEIISFFDRAIGADRLAHAYLFLGPKQVGRMAVARKLAAKVLGSDAGLERHPDFLVVERGRDAKSGKLHADIVLDQIHALRGWLSRGAFLDGRPDGSGPTGWKVVIVDGAQHLNKEAANALLKSLEEPKAKTLLLLLAETADGIYPTIRSRCQLVHFGRVRTEEIADALAAAGLDAGQSGFLARLSGGCPGLALGLFQDEAALAAMLARRGTLLDLIESGIGDRWAILDKAMPAKLPFNEAVVQALGLLDVLAELMRDALLLAHGRGEKLTHDDVRPRLEAWAARAGRANIAAGLQEINDARRLLGENVNPRAVLENVALVIA